MSTVTEQVRTSTGVTDQPTDAEPDSLAPEGEPYVLTSAETAECTCPDACERDHDNE